MISFGLCVFLGLHGVTSPPIAHSQPGRTPPPATKADAATLALARTLTAEFQKERYFSDATLQRPGSLAALGYLALTSKEAPLVQRAYESIGKGLEALASGDKDPRAASPLAIEAIMAGLGRGERPILDKALFAASHLNLGREAHQPSLQAIADLALKHGEPDVRYAALSALYQVGSFVATRSEVLPETMALAMDDPSEAVVYMNMSQFNTMGRSSAAFTARHARISASFKRLRSQGSPLMRAAAFAATAKMLYPGIELPGVPRPEPGPDALAFASEVLRALDDPSPIVRGMAASAAGLLRFVEGGTPKLVTMLEDTASVSATIAGLRSLGSDDPIELPIRAVDFGEPETVAMTALRALMLRSLYQETKPELRLTCPVPAKTFAECARRARAWGRRVSGDLPAAGAAGAEGPWAPPADAVRVGGAVKMPHRLVTVEPEYPQEARLQGISGNVIVEALIGRKGEIAALHVMRGVKGLDQAALDAVRHWVFEPTSVGGKPVPVIVTLIVNFRK
jgi:TonB family protein